MHITRRKFITTGLLTTGALLFTESFWFERYFIEVNKFYFGSTNSSTKNLKIIQISDLHLHAVTYQLKQLAEMINKLQPELIAITGDAIDRKHNIPVLDSFLKLIDNRIKKVAVLGNWEYQAHVDIDQLNKMYRTHNCDLLLNESKQYTFHQKTVAITGVDDYLRGSADFGTAMHSYLPSDYHVVLSHCPQYRDDIAIQLDNEKKVDFVLSGHTHGGQINLFGFAPYLPQGSGRYFKGWYKDEYPKLYVSKGVGTGVVPFRFCARAEVAIFNLAV